MSNSTCFEGELSKKGVLLHKILRTIKSICIIFLIIGLSNFLFYKILAIFFHKWFIERVIHDWLKKHAIMTSFSRPPAKRNTNYVLNCVKTLVFCPYALKFGQKNCLIVFFQEWRWVKKNSGFIIFLKSNSQYRGSLIYQKPSPKWV